MGIPPSIGFGVASKTKRESLSTRERGICAGNDVAKQYAKQGARQSDMDKARDMAYAQTEAKVEWTLRYIAAMTIAVGEWPDVEKVVWSKRRVKRTQFRKMYRRSKFHKTARRLGTMQLQGRYVNINGHALMFSAPLLWCNSCGRYTEKRVAGLARTCTRAPANKSAEAVRRKLQQARHPLTGANLVSVQRVTSEMWDKFNSTMKGVHVELV